MDTEKFCLKWNEFETNLSVAFRELREEKDFFDVTLACDDSQIEAHKVIVSACSPFFRNVLRRNPHPHPLIFLKGVKFKELLSVINFMYMGEANVAQDELNTFLAVAEELEVKGLTQKTTESPKQEDYSQSECGAKDHVKKKTLPPPHKHIGTNQPAAKKNWRNEHKIQEVTAVKSEPSELVMNQSAFTAPAGYQAEAHYQGEEEEEDDPGTVALDDVYAGDEGYDYQYDDGYENTNTAMPAADTGWHAQGSWQVYLQLKIH